MVKLQLSTHFENKFVLHLFQVLEEPFLDHYTITDGYQIQNGQFLYTLRWRSCLYLKYHPFQ